MSFKVTKLDSPPKRKAAARKPTLKGSGGPNKLQKEQMDMSKKTMKKQRKKINYQQTTEDKLTSLPDNVFLHILSFLQTKHAVQTCLLLCKSSQRFWSLVPDINLDFRNSNNTSSILADRLVSRILMSRRSRNSALNVRSFCLYYCWNIGIRLVRRILKFAFSHNVQRLTLKALGLCPVFPHELLLVCKEVTALELGNFRFEGLQTVGSLKALTSLHLCYCSFSVANAGIRCRVLDFLSGCDNIRVLRLFGCKFIGADVLRVIGPELVELEIMGGNRGAGSSIGVKDVQIYAPKAKYFKFDCSSRVELHLLPAL